MSKHDDRHGGPYDRGLADAWYNRPHSPHYYVGATGSSEKVGPERMTPEEIGAYTDGWNEGNEPGAEHKDWG